MVGFWVVVVVVVGLTVVVVVGCVGGLLVVVVVFAVVVVVGLIVVVACGVCVFSTGLAVVVAGAGVWGGCGFAGVTTFGFGASARPRNHCADTFRLHPNRSTAKASTSALLAILHLRGAKRAEIGTNKNMSKSKRKLCPAAQLLAVVSVPNDSEWIHLSCSLQSALFDRLIWMIFSSKRNVYYCLLRNTRVHCVYKMRTEEKRRTRKRDREKESMQTGKSVPVLCGTLAIDVRRGKCWICPFRFVSVWFVRSAYGAHMSELHQL